MGNHLRSITWLRFGGGLVLVCLLLGSAGASFADTTYTVNLSIGSTGSVTGSIVTDGTIGSLTASDFVDWNLTVSDTVHGSVDLLGPLSGNNSFVAGILSDESATATNLLFNFSATDQGYLYFEGNSAPATFVCFGPGGGGGFNQTCAVGQAGNVEGISDQNFEQSTLLTGSQVIGTVSTAPEPGSVVSLLTGMGALGLLAGLVKRKELRVQDRRQITA
jgi:hypothetical protein